MMEFETREAAAETLAERIAAALAEDIAERGAATFLTSGGSTPKQTLTVLAGKPIDWSKVRVGLVDERCVGEDHPASNAAFVRTSLLQGPAAAATFVPLFTPGLERGALAPAAGERYAPLAAPSFMLLGMGADAHTASWFPGAANLEEALSADAPDIVLIDAKGCPVAGEVTDRLTLTRPAVAAARRAALLIYGDEKKSVLANATSKTAAQAPITAAVGDLGDRLDTMWAR